jgi:hypothetical protein
MANSKKRTGSVASASYSSGQLSTSKGLRGTTGGEKDMFQLKLRWMESRIRTISKDLGEVTSGLFQAKQDIKNIQIPIIEALGIFVALFTFVSVNIQIFSRITSINNAFIFVVLMFLCLCGFVYILHLFLTDQKCAWRFFLVMLTLGSTFILIFSFTADRAKLMIEENSEFTKIEKGIKSLEDKFEVHLQTRE